MRGPNTIILMAALRPSKHSRVKFNIQSCAQSAQGLSRIGQNILAVYNQGPMTKPICHLVKKLGLLHEPDIIQIGSFTFFRVRGHDQSRVSDQKHIVALAHKAAVKLFDHM